MKHVILVDEEDNELGIEEKQKAHELGLLHRCFSIQIFNSKGEQLLQKRAKSKYHSGGLWSNACCGHPQKGEDILAAAQRGLKEEMSLHCPLKLKTVFTYRAEFQNGLTEHEIDHLFIGFTDENPNPSPEEAEEWKWIAKKYLEEDMRKNPEKYSAWFQVITQKKI